MSTEPEEVDPVCALGPAVCVAPVNLRSGPGTAYAIRRGLRQGTPVTLWGWRRDWRLVQLADGTTGWVYRDLVKPVGPKEAQGG